MATRRAFLLALVIPLAWAQPSRAEPIAVRATATGPCADDAALERELRARSTRVRIERTAPTEVQLRTEQSGEGARGTLVWIQPGAAPRTRELEAPTCEEVVTALAFVAALALDPDASAPPPPSSRSDEREPASDSAPAAPERSREATARPSPPRAPAPFEPARPRSATGERRLLRVRLEGAIHGLAAGRGVESVAGGAGIAAGIALGSSARPASVRLGFDGETASLAADPARGNATWLVGRAAACGPGWTRGPLSAAPCLSVRLGQLTVSPRGVDRGSASSRLWADVAAGARLALRLGVTPWVVEFEPRAELPMTRDRFLVAGAGTLYRPPALAAAASLAVGVSFL